MPAPLPWSAPQSGPLRATVTLPGSKSLTARALLLAALSDAPSTLTGVLRSRDTALMRAALEALGARIEDVVDGPDGALPAPAGPDGVNGVSAPDAAHGPDGAASPSNGSDRHAHPSPATGTTVRVTPAPLPLHVRPSAAGLSDAARQAGAVAAIDCGLAGTVMRFLPPLLAVADAPVLLDGDDAARRRPLAGLLDALTGPLDHGGLGAHVTFLGEDGYLPLVLTPASQPHHAPTTGQPDHTSQPSPATHPGRQAGTGQATASSPPTGTSQPTPITVDSSASSQFLSALLMAGCLVPGGAAVTAVGPVPSLPHVAMTVTSLRERGVRVTEPGLDGPPTWTVAAGQPQAADRVIEPDLSNAGPFLAAALVAGGSVSVPAWPVRTTQAGDAWRWLLPALGGTVTTAPTPDGASKATLTVTAAGTGALRGIDADLSAVGELAPTVAALATLASAQGHGSRLRGIAHLRGHETNRLAALVTEINRLGGHATETTDGIDIAPLAPGQELHAACLRTYADHRMATFAAIIGLAVPGVRLDDVACTAKTLPDFPALWTGMLAQGAEAGTHPGAAQPGTHPGTAQPGATTGTSQPVDQATEGPC